MPLRIPRDLTKQTFTWEADPSLQQALEYEVWLRRELAVCLVFIEVMKNPHPHSPIFGDDKPKKKRGRPKAEPRPKEE